MQKLISLTILCAGVALGASTLTNRTYTSVQDLVNRKGMTDARVALAPKTSDADTSFVRALAANLPATAPAMRTLFDTIMYKGAIEPEVKLAMGLRIAQFYESPYLAAQTERRLRATTRGQALLKTIGNRPIANPVEADALALSYAEKLSADVHGISDQDFAMVRGKYNDSQIVELTVVTCYFNYLVRFAEALRLPVEDWPFEKTAPASSVELPIAKVSLITNAEMDAIQALKLRAEQNARQAPGAGLGIAIANSMRAMYLSPAAALAWQGYGAAAGQYTSVDRTLKLHISFAVSMANDCRYCTLHQVMGLRRQGVDISKLVAMKKDDSMLSPRELTAVQFARKLTDAPASITDADYAKLRATFGEQGAIEVVMQTSNFAYMNRFTDNLRLPSEDEAISIYKETYGTNYAHR